jgi:molybdopterin converting factor small subunit
MPTVWIPKAMQTYTRGKETVEMEGRTVRRLIVALDETYPGLKDALMDGDRLKPGIAVAVNGQISHLGPLQRLEENNEVFFVPAIGGG